MKNFIFLIITFFFITGCEQKPVDVDRSGKDQFILIDTTGLLEKDPSTGLALLKNQEVSFTTPEYNLSFKFNSNENGIVYATGLPASRYTISVNKQVGESFAVFGSKTKDIFGLINSIDTIYLKSMPSSALILNEIFACGSVNNKNYMFDLYVELFNNSDDIKYLDGIIMCKVGTGPVEQNGIAIVNLGNVMGVKLTYAYQFPGTPGGTQYPIYPGQLVMIAGDAIDHRIPIPTSIDLSLNNPVFKNSDPNFTQLWEFYNSNSSDIDVATVPNVNNILAKTTVDFYVGLTSDALAISSGKKGLIYSGESDVYIDLTTIMDGVQYASKTTTTRKIDGRIDGGTAGIGIANYSGKSIERKILDPSKPKKRFDTNNSTIDFGINDTPTPGYQGNPK